MADIDPDLPDGSALRIAESLKTAILAGRYAPGQRLIEADLSRDTGAGRALVREALRHLRGEGLVDIERNRGAVVKRLSRADVFHAGRIRESLEGLAARLIAERALPDVERAALTDLRRRLVAAADAQDFDAYIAANEELHRFIVVESANPYLLSFLERLRLVVRQTQHMAAFRTRTLFDGNVEHLAIIDAILLGHPDAAETMMRMHVRKGTQMIDEWLAGEG